MSRIDVALVDKCIRDLKTGKAMALITLVLSTCSLLILRMLLQLIFRHGYVPEGFGLGLTIPLVKDKAGNLNDSDNYRAITVGPVIAKVMENVIIKLRQHNLCTDDLQFGFKQGLICTNPVFLCRSTIDHVTHRGRNV